MSLGHLRKFLPLFMVLFIDSMGMGILFPILAVAFMNPSAHFLAINASHAMRTLDYGIVVSVFMLCWFFGAAILGEYSDYRGRKRCLFICLAGASIGYGLSAMALAYHSLSLLILGRVIAGLTAGSQSIAQAAIVDGSTEDQLTKNMGYMSLVICLGFVAGPMIGGVFSDAHLIWWFSLSTPMWVATFLSLLNMVLLLMYFKESHQVTERKEFHLLNAITLFTSAFKHPNIRILCIIFLVFIFGWSNYYSFISLYLVSVYHYTAVKTAMFSVCLGLGFCLGSGVLNARLSHYGSKRLALVSAIFATAGCLLSLITQSEVMLWVYAFVIGTTIAIIYPNIITLFSLQVSEEEQGWVMGVSGSMMAISFGLTTLASGALSMIHADIPLWLAVIGIAGSAVILLPAKLKQIAGE